ncbi:MAG: hypothetical protein K2L04_04230 [Alistipes sp.]|nr:hypothetical protein [Alistipes sp.]
MKEKSCWNEFKKRFKSFFTPSVWATILFGCISIILLLVINKSASGFYVEKIANPILTSILAAVVVSLSFDVKKHVASLQSVIVDAFTSNNFLEKLPDERLKELRSATITEMHKQKYPNMQKGLMNMDREIFSALMHPYYESFRETAIYYKHKKFAWNAEGTEEPVLYRTVNIQYVIKSPTRDTESTWANLSIKKCIQNPIKSELHQDDINRIFKLKHFYVSIDDGKRTDISEDVKYIIRPLDSSDEYYNTSVVLSCGQNCDRKFYGSHNNDEGIFVEYKTSVQVEIEYEIYLPKEDNHFTNRLKYPTKSFRVDCICNDDDNVRMYGELLGTFTENQKIRISHPKDNIISIEAFDWLLPRNGVFVVLGEKNVQKDRT